MYKQRLITAVLGSCLLLVGASCSRDVRLAGRDIPENVQVKTITEYGIFLDESATPKQVAFVLLRALKEDFLAASPKERAAALHVEFEVCAPETIVSKLPDILTHDELLYRVVDHWAPTVGLYVGDIDSSFEKMETRFVQRGLRQVTGAAEGVMECKILIVLNEPSGNPNAAVVLALAMIQEEKHWRVERLAFAPTVRSLDTLSAAKTSKN